MLILKRRRAGRAISGKYNIIVDTYCNKAGVYLICRSLIAVQGYIYCVALCACIYRVYNI